MSLHLSCTFLEDPEVIPGLLRKFTVTPGTFMLEMKRPKPLGYSRVSTGRLNIIPCIRSRERSLLLTINLVLGNVPHHESVTVHWDHSSMSSAENWHRYFTFVLSFAQSFRGNYLSVAHITLPGSFVVKAVAPYWPYLLSRPEDLLINFLQPSPSGLLHQTSTSPHSISVHLIIR